MRAADVEARRRPRSGIRSAAPWLALALFAACHGGGASPGAGTGGMASGGAAATGAGGQGGLDAGAGGGAGRVAAGGGGGAGTAGAAGGSGGGDTGGGAGGTGAGGAGAGGSAVDGGVDAAVDALPVPGTPCASNNDCGGGPPYFLMCQAPGESFGCPICQTATDECATDADCAADGGATPGMRTICLQAPATACYCQPTKLCQTGCRTGDDCGAGQACDTTNHCQATCAPGTCPADFACGGDSFCHRITCTSDAACSGACVKGYCYDRPGACTGAAA